MFRQLLHFNQKVVSELSRFNCHVRGLHSIVLLRKESGQLLRLYIAEPGSDLHKGYQHLSGAEARQPNATLKLGLHAHHCDLELFMVKGEAYHWTYKKYTPQVSGFFHQPFSLPAFRYQSPLREKGAGRFMRDGWQDFVLWAFQRLDAGMSLDRLIKLRANDYHTMGIPAGQGWVAWLVTEGQEDHEYEPLTYSHHNLERFDFTGMYQPMNHLQAIDLLQKAGLL